MNHFLFILIGLFLIWGLYLALIHPEKTNVAKYPWLKDQSFAHRGLYFRDQTIPENSLSAFRRAIEEGHGIELDIHLTKDDQLIVFHDDTLKRMTGVDTKTEDLTYEELSGLRLCETEEKIPLFSEVLELIGGRVSLIVEIKAGHNNKLLCEKAYALLKEYCGNYCIESFRPDILHWFYKNAPKVLRGQLSMKFPLIGKGASLTKWLLGKLIFNFYAHPQFIAYNVKHSSLGLDLSRKMGAMTIAWTIRDEKGEDKANFYFDSYIFEQKDKDESSEIQAGDTAATEPKDITAGEENPATKAEK